MNTYLLVASVLTFLTWCVHTFMGTRDIAGPLLRSEMDPVPKYTNFYCWHGITVVLAAMSGGYLYAALVPAGRDLAVFVTAIGVALSLLGLLLVFRLNQKTIDMPQWVLFAIISAVAIPGL